MPEYDDVALEQILRRTLADHLRPMSLDLTVEHVEARARVAARKRADRRRLVVLGLAAALILPVGWLLAGAPRPDFPSADTYQILVARWQAGPGDTGAVDALDVVAIRSDGQERLVRRLRQEEMPEGYRLGYNALASQDGWLAVSDMDGTHWALLDLSDETGEIQRIEANNSNQPVGWGPDGRFAWIDTRGMNVIDPRTGVTETDTSGWSTEESDVFWTHDASGFAVISGTPMRSYLGNPGRLSWQNRPLGSSPGQSFVPAYEPLENRRYSLAGDRFVVCSGPVHGLGMCPGDGRGLVVRQDLAGTVTEWDVTTASGAPMSAGFASSDRGMWLVSQDYPGEADSTASSSLEGRVILERLDDQARVRQTLGAALGAGFSDPSLGGMAPDDSLARIDTTAEDPDTTSWILLPTDGSPATYHVGDFIGFVPTSAAERLPGGVFQPTVGVDAPPVGRAKDLVSAETLERYAETSIGVTRDDRVVLRAASTDTGSGSRTLTFSIAPGHRIGVQIACSGRGTMDVTVADQGFGAECMADDQHAYGYTVDGVDGTDLPIQVNAERGAAWRIVVFDIRIPGTS